MNAKKTMEKPSWLNALTEEKIEVEPFTQSKEEILGIENPEIWHYCDSRNWADSTKEELESPFSFRVRKDLAELAKKHIKGSKNQSYNDLIAMGLKYAEEQYRKTHKK